MITYQDSAVLTNPSDQGNNSLLRHATYLGLPGEKLGPDPKYTIRFVNGDPGKGTPSGSARFSPTPGFSWFILNNIPANGTLVLTQEGRLTIVDAAGTPCWQATQAAPFSKFDLLV